MLVSYPPFGFAVKVTAPLSSVFTRFCTEKDAVPLTVHIVAFKYIPILLGILACTVPQAILPGTVICASIRISVETISIPLVILKMPDIIGTVSEDLSSEVMLLVVFHAAFVEGSINIHYYCSSVELAFFFLLANVY